MGEVITIFGLSLGAVLLIFFVGLVIAFVIAHLTGTYARKRGRDYTVWFMIGLVIPLLALLILAVLPPENHYHNDMSSRERIGRGRSTDIGSTRIRSLTPKAPLAAGWIMIGANSSGPRQVQLHKGDNWIGRSSECEVVLDDDSISRRHAKIGYRGNGVFEIADGGSRNGTRVNGHRTSRATLNDGDSIQLGDMTVVFKSMRN